MMNGSVKAQRLSCEYLIDDRRRSKHHLKMKTRKYVEISCFSLFRDYSIYKKRNYKMRIDADDVEIAGGVFPLAEYADAEDPDKEACADAYNWASDELQYL